MDYYVTETTKTIPLFIGSLDEAKHFMTDFYLTTCNNKSEAKTKATAFMSTYLGHTQGTLGDLSIIDQVNFKATQNIEETIIY